MLLPVPLQPVSSPCFAFGHLQVKKRAGWGATGSGARWARGFPVGR